MGPFPHDPNSTTLDSQSAVPTRHKNREECGNPLRDFGSANEVQETRHSWGETPECYEYLELVCPPRYVAGTGKILFALSEV